MLDWTEALDGWNRWMPRYRRVLSSFSTTRGVDVGGDRAEEFKTRRSPKCGVHYSFASRRRARFGYCLEFFSIPACLPLVSFLPSQRGQSFTRRHKGDTMRAPIAVTFGLLICGAAATASAQSTVRCTKPWTVPDKWIDVHDAKNDNVWTTDDTFETVDDRGNPLSDPDVYSDIYTDPVGGTGFRIPRDVGLPLVLKLGDPQQGMTSGWFYAVDLGNAGGGADSYRSAIATCQDMPLPHFGDVLTPLAGLLKGPTVQGVADLINLDPTAEWDPVTRTVIHSCAPSVACGSVSPRVVVVVAFNPAVFERSLLNGGRPQLVATNIFGVFIDGIVDGKVTGYLTTLPWTFASQ